MQELDIAKKFLIQSIQPEFKLLKSTNPNVLIIKVVGDGPILGRIHITDNIDKIVFWKMQKIVQQSGRNNCSWWAHIFPSNLADIHVCLYNPNSTTLQLSDPDFPDKMYKLISGWWEER